MPRKSKGPDLNEVSSLECQRCSNREERSVNSSNGLCTTALSVLDGLPVRCVGSWAFEKSYRLTQYFGIFCLGMHNKWPALNYVEICSGPGRCVFREDGQEVDGTALA